MDPTERMTVDGAMKHNFLKHHALQPRSLDGLCPAVAAGGRAGSRGQADRDPRRRHWPQCGVPWYGVARW